MLSETIDFSSFSTPQATAPAEPPKVARINGVALTKDSETLSTEELRQRACTELLRQAAMQAGVLDAADPAPHDGVISEAASLGIEALLERELQMPEPSTPACSYHTRARSAFCSSSRGTMR